MEGETPSLSALVASGEVALGFRTPSGEHYALPTALLEDIPAVAEVFASLDLSGIQEQLEEVVQYVLESSVEEVVIESDNEALEPPTKIPRTEPVVEEKSSSDLQQTQLSTFFAKSSGAAPLPTGSTPSPQPKTTLPEIDWSKNYYDILGVNRAATKAAIRAAFLRVSARYHPDKAGYAFTETFQRLSHIHDILMNAGTRREYNKDNTAFPFPGDAKPKSTPKGTEAKDKKAKGAKTKDEQVV